MVVVQIVLWPGGDRTKERPLGVALIANDTTGTKERGNYDVRLTHSGRHVEREGVWKTGRVVGHARNLSPYHLVLNALAACLKPLGRERGAADRVIAWLEAYEERAAILEYEANMPRAEAERKALELVGPPPTRAAEGS